MAVYDALYLTIAESAGATFVTADKSLYDRISSLPFVRWLGDLGGGAATLHAGDATGERSPGTSS